MTAVMSGTDSKESANHSVPRVVSAFILPSCQRCFPLNQLQERKLELEVKHITPKNVLLKLQVGKRTSAVNNRYGSTIAYFIS